MDNYKVISWSKLIKKLLQKQFMTQGELAERCCVSQKAVSLWINEKCTPSKLTQKILLEMAEQLKQHDASTSLKEEFDNEEIALLQYYRRLPFHHRKNVLNFTKFLHAEKE